MEGKYLITTDSWFYGHDGKKYRSVYGTVKVLKDSFLGIDTNRNSTNWYIQVGNEYSHLIIAGCQIHYAQKLGNAPFSGRVKEIHYDGAGKSEEVIRDSEILILQ